MVTRTFAPRFWIAALGVLGFVGLLVAAPHAPGQTDLVRAAGLIWFLFFAALAFGAPKHPEGRRGTSRRR